MEPQRRVFDNGAVLWLYDMPDKDVSIIEEFC
jgi:hypothetical protein